MSGKYELHPLPRVAADPLKFRDTKRYDARLKEAQAKAEGTTDALVVASGLMGGRMTVMPRSISASWAARWARRWARGW